jgi:hypothetical protein
VDAGFWFPTPCGSFPHGAPFRIGRHYSEMIFNLFQYTHKVPVRLLTFAGCRFLVFICPQRNALDWLRGMLNALDSQKAPHHETCDSTGWVWEDHRDQPNLLRTNPTGNTSTAETFMSSS